MSGFWDESTYYTGPPLTAAMVQGAEARLGYRLPAAYVALLQDRNGGSPLRDCHPSPVISSWASDHLCIAGIKGIGGERGIDAPQFGSAALIKQYRLPPIGVVFGETPDLAYGVFMFDYSASGPQGEPAVVHVEVKRGAPVVTQLAGDFLDFLRGLQSLERRHRSADASAAGGLLAPEATLASLDGAAPADVESTTSSRYTPAMTLLGLALILTLLRQLRVASTQLDVLFTGSGLEGLLTSGSPTHDPGFVALVAIESLLVLVFIILLAVTLINFFEKSYRFTFTFDLFMAFTLLAPLIYTVAFQLLSGAPLLTLLKKCFQLASLCYPAVFGAPYVRLSKDVEAVFSRGRP